MKPALAQPIVVFIFTENRGPTSTRFGGFITRLKKAGHLKNCEAKAVALKDLVFSIDENMKAAITDKDGKAVLDDASLIYMKSWEAEPELASAVAQYAMHKGIVVIDDVVMDAGVHKLSQLFKMWAANVPVTPTVFSHHSFPLPTSFRHHQQFILKPPHGQKGRDTLLVDVADVEQTVTDLPSAPLVQPFIPNEGDYRVLVYGYKVRGALLRRAIEGSHLNNTSAGATSNFIPANELPEEIATIAIKAARAVHLSVAGVDIVVHSETKKPYVLEVNQGSQVVTGHFIGEKMAAFDDFLHETLQSRYAGKQQRLSMIGRHARVNFPTLGIDNILAKIDTGAYYSALHAADIQVEDTPDGPVLQFTVDYTTATGELVTKRLRTTEFDTAEITNTSGIPQLRYRLDVEIEINGEVFLTPVTLADRSQMKTPLILGRRLLRGRFLVNTELSRKAYEAQL